MLKCGLPGEIRTHDLPLRRRTLYPAELRGGVVVPNCVRWLTNPFIPHWRQNAHACRLRSIKSHHPSAKWAHAEICLVRGRGDGGAEGNRTPDLDSAIVALSQLSYGPIRIGPDATLLATLCQRCRRVTIGLSVIIPVRNECCLILGTLQRLQYMRERGTELVLVDGGSIDGTVEIARPWVDRVLMSPPGRARQMNLGAEVASGEGLWFLHGDTLAPENADQVLRQALAEGSVWGHFDIRLSGHRAGYRVVEWFMNQRVRVTGVVTGDHGLFVRREAFIKVGGYPDIALMEDIELSRRLRSEAKPRRAPGSLETSSRKWEREGLVRTVIRMWLIRSAYFLGVKPDDLCRWYYRDSMQSDRMAPVAGRKD